MPRPPLQTLSGAHRRIAEMMAEFERHERPAYVSELVEALKLARPSSLTPTLQIMARNGFVDLPGKSAGGKRRAQIVRLTPRGRHALGIGGLPLLGNIPAGLMSEAVADYITANTQISPTRQGRVLCADSNGAGTATDCPALAP